MPMSSETGAASAFEPGAEEGRPSAIDPHIKLERRVSPFFGLIFYGFLLGAAWVWMASTGQPIRELWIPKHGILEIAVGLGAGVLFVALTPLSMRFFPSIRELEREFGWILGEQRRWECLYLAILSATAEEFFFRGAVHGALGPFLGTLLFAALHWPINAQFRAWPVLAVIAGVVLTAERMWTGTLIAPILTHAVINSVNLIRLTRKYRVWSE